MRNVNDKFHRLVDCLNSLPSIGKKTSIKLAYDIIIDNPLNGIKLANAIEEATSSINRCSKCGYISENEICNICLDESRDKSKVCIVESAKDIFLLEENSIFNGVYFVLEHKQNLEAKIEKLKNVIAEYSSKEVIFAMSVSIENDAIMTHTGECLKDMGVTLSKIAHGVPTGVRLENVDVSSLLQALKSRVKI